MLYTKCILFPIEQIDGVRVSIMSRHTLNDGITPDLRITKRSYDLWLQEFAPPSNLIGSYYQKRILWEEFELMYKVFLSEPIKAAAVRILAEQALIKDITLLCIEKTAEKCHRRLFAEQCLLYSPRLNIIHK